MLITIRDPKVTPHHTGDTYIYRTDVMGAIQNGHRCGTCGGGRKLFIFTIGEPDTTDTQWWKRQRIFCSMACWAGRSPLRKG